MTLKTELFPKFGDFFFNIYSFCNNQVECISLRITYFVNNCILKYYCNILLNIYFITIAVTVVITVK